MKTAVIPHCIHLRDITPKQKPCPFCAIVKGDAPAERVSETKTTLAFAPLNPAAEGHTLIVPKEHVTFLWDLPSFLYRPLMAEIARLSRVLMDKHRPEGMNLIQSNCEAATQSIFHVHFHLVPRWAGDAMGSIWP